MLFISYILQKLKLINTHHFFKKIGNLFHPKVSMQKEYHNHIIKYVFKKLEFIGKKKNFD